MAIHCLTLQTTFINIFSIPHSPSSSQHYNPQVLTLPFFQQRKRSVPRLLKPTSGHGCCPTCLVEQLHARSLSKPRNLIENGAAKALDSRGYGFALLDLKRTALHTLCRPRLCSHWQIQQVG
jgi:hypothetical protein